MGKEGFWSLIKLNVKIHYRREVERYVNRILRNLKPRSIILYGSAIRSTFGVGSDIDMLVISDYLPANFLKRLEVLFELNTSPAPLEALGYTPIEFERMVKRMHLTALYALEEGLIVYDDGYLEQVKSAFKGLKKELGLKMIEGGWEIEAPSL